MAPPTSQSKRIIVIRGFPGSGRTTLAHKIGKEGKVLSIEDFYGEPIPSEDVFTSYEVARAATELLVELDQSIKEGHSLIVVDTPALRLWELRDILHKAEAASYSFKTEEPSTPWARDAQECAAKTHHPLKDSTWQWLLTAWEIAPNEQAIRDALSPDERIRHAKWLISLGAQKGIPPEEVHRFLFDNFDSEIAELSRSGFLASPELHQAFLTKLRAEGRTPPRFIEFPSPDFGHHLDQLAKDFTDSLPSAEQEKKQGFEL